MASNPAPHTFTHTHTHTRQTQARLAVPVSGIVSGMALRSELFVGAMLMMAGAHGLLSFVCLALCVVVLLLACESVPLSWFCLFVSLPLSDSAFFFFIRIGLLSGNLFDFWFLIAVQTRHVCLCSLSRAQFCGVFLFLMYVSACSFAPL